MASRAIREMNRRTEETLQALISGQLKAKNGRIQYPTPPPPAPPTGTYDPALDAQRRAAQSGLLYMQQDTELANARAGQDYTFGLEDLTRSRDRGYADIDRDLMLLGRSYKELERTQAERAAAAGVLSPGLALKAASIRAENMAIDRQPLDTARTRLGEDFSTQSGRLAVDYGRGVFDRNTALTRAGQQNTQFGLDLDAQRLYQAGQAGWVAPPPAASPGTGGAQAPAPRPTTGANTNQGSGFVGASRVRNGQREFQWPNGSWHSRRHSTDRKA